MQDRTKYSELKYLGTRVLEYYRIVPWYSSTQVLHTVLLEYLGTLSTRVLLATV